MICDNYTIKNAKVLFPKSDFKPYEKLDIRVKNGKIDKIGTFSSEGELQIDAKEKILVPSFCDVGVCVGEPGNEDAEDYNSLAEAAMAGGFTTVAIFPNTNPVTQHKSQAGTIVKNGIYNSVDFLPIGALTEKSEGRLLNELYELSDHGCVAFSDFPNPIWHSDLFLKALEYLKPVGGLVIDFARDKYLGSLGLMHEGDISTILGFPGVPVLSEELAIKKNLEILHLIGGRLHFSGVSTIKGLNSIKEAQEKGFEVSCDISVWQLAFLDNDLVSFDTNLKVRPPFRSAEIRDFIKGELGKTISVVKSGHSPVKPEDKEVEFDQAEYGISSIESAFATLMTFSEISLESAVELLSINPRKLLGQKTPSLNEAESFRATLVDPDATFTFEKNKMYSKSKNTPFQGKRMKGLINASFSGERIYNALG